MDDVSRILGDTDPKDFEERLKLKIMAAAMYGCMKALTKEGSPLNFGEVLVLAQILDIVKEEIPDIESIDEAMVRKIEQRQEAGANGNQSK